VEIFDQCLVIDALPTDSPQNANGGNGRTSARLHFQPTFSKSAIAGGDVIHSQWLVMCRLPTLIWFIV
jgi:hypothetical protein